MNLNNRLLSFNYQKVLRCLLLAGIALSVIACGQTGTSPTVTKEPLPYPKNALEPFISAKTMRLHYGKHYAGYVSETNRLLSDGSLDAKTLVDVVRAASAKKTDRPLFNNAAQAWNHAFFWKCLKPNGGGKPRGPLAEAIDDSFGSFKQFKKEFTEAARNHFGSGWVWLVADGETLKITVTEDAGTPLTTDLIPIFTVDIWEHAYYLDYQNRRAAFVKTVLKELANWDFAATQLAAVGQ